MYNEHAYKATYDEMVTLACPFEKAILSRCADCSLARKLNIAEREAVACSMASASENCMEMHDLMRRNALFALKLSQQPAVLPHAKEIRIQCGGLLGLGRLIDPDVSRSNDIQVLVARLQAQYESLAALPWSEVVKEISAFEGRRRR